MDTYFTTDEAEAGEANYLPACITGCEQEDDAEFRCPEQRAGYMAGIEGSLQSENPYIAGTREAIDWDDGWSWSVLTVPID